MKIIRKPKQEEDYELDWDMKFLFLKESCLSYFYRRMKPFGLFHIQVAIPIGQDNSDKLICCIEAKGYKLKFKDYSRYYFERLK